MAGKAVQYTAAQIRDLGKENIPKELSGGHGLVYSSPATLAYNSPGAEGFGVKRAGLAVPESVMLIVAPGCCGRNTSIVSSMPQYKDRFFYLMMDETDLVTGRHLKRIPDAVCEVVSHLEKKGSKPRVVMICITCVDALLGTDMERVCSACERALGDGTRVRPSYMYALTREGRRPPMVHVRQTLYSLLEPMEKDPRSVNIIGNFAPLEDGELQKMLFNAGVKHIRQISTCGTYDEFLKMASANFNIVTNPEVRAAAHDMSSRLGIPYIELTRTYDVAKTAAQYKAFANAVGITIDISEEESKAKEAVESLKADHPDLTFNIGECLNADPFELALSLVRYGFKVGEIYAALAPEKFKYVSKLAELSPDTKIFCNMEPTMLYYDVSASRAHISLGKDAAFYCPDIPNIAWNSDIQPFGFQGITKLMETIGKIMKEARA
ncbi:MAG: nitrogenase component 1 [Saccharofermentans sp.]|nr:nitrogenase component 1 [Saccharofermentans sp.]